MQQRPRFSDQTPPAIFPAMFGMLGLALAWRRAAGVFGVPVGVADLLLGAGAALILFGAFAYGLKCARRAGVFAEDIAILPGRTGITAMALSFYVLAAGLVPISPGLALAALVAGLCVHVAMLAVFLRWLAAAPHEQRVVNPAWHLHFVGFIIAPLAAVPLGFVGASAVVLAVTAPIAALIWLISIWQLVTRIPPAPLRPMLAIHLAPASLLGTVALMLGYPTLALVYGAIATAILAGLVVFVRWITVAGFSALWGAFTFPLAAYASLCMLLAAAGQGGAFRVLGGVALVAATLIIPPITLKVLQAWARGGLAAKTNAARV